MREKLFFSGIIGLFALATIFVFIGFCFHALAFMDAILIVLIIAVFVAAAGVLIGIWSGE
jgi:hypothetical protein